MHRVVKELEKKKNERKFTFAGDQEIEKVFYLAIFVVYNNFILIIYIY